MGHPQRHISALAEMLFVVNVGEYAGTMKERKWNFIVKENYLYHRRRDKYSRHGTIKKREKRKRITTGQ